VLGIVAQLIPRKGHALLLDCLAAIAPQWPQVRLIIFGRGPQEEALRKQVTTLGLAQQVVFAGFRDDLPRWLGALDLLVHPASMEGLGISLLQAAAAGVPVLACRAGGIPEAVADGVTGLLVAANDAPALTAALLRLLQDPALRQHLGTAGPAWIAQEFTAPLMAAGNRAVYTRLIAERPASQP
jgi:glycosyltransferase involved in cell wall biosynthesis